ncbi:MAG TPA: tetratricopeptide repeat protein, partial [Povalibacter sp.]|nr:tetratricopeptide repeat protein [Povalibacter sp.]
AVGEILAQAGLLDEALTNFTAAQAAGSAAAALNAARAQLALGRDEQARQSLEAALKLSPGWLLPQRMLVELDVRQGRVDQAVTRARSATQQAGGQAAAVTQSEGDVQALAKRFSQAATAYEKAWHEQPSLGLAVKLFAARTAAGQKTNEAEQLAWLRQQSAAQPGQREALAQYYVQTGRRPDAIAEYQRLVSAAENDWVLLNNLAWLYQEVGDKRAEETARRAYGLAPQSGPVADTLGWILLGKGSVPEGLKVLESAHNASPSDPNIAYHLAVAYQRSGAEARAVELLDRTLSAAPSFALRKDAETLRQSLAHTSVKAN